MLIGVDGGADALLEEGYRPDLIVGDMDSVSDATLTCGAEVVVHAYRDGNAPGLERVRKLGLDPVVFPATGTSEDVAMLLADDKGATIIVAVGTHATLVEFLDKGRSGMASTFLTRLRVGGKLVDAKGVSQLYRIAHLQPVPGGHADRRPLRPVRRPGRHPRRHRHARAGRCPVGRRWSLVVRNLHVIDFRYHLVSIVSIFLALAVGHRARCRSAQGGPGQHPDPRAHPAARRTRPACAPTSTAAAEGHRRPRHLGPAAVAPRSWPARSTGKKVAVVVAPGRRRRRRQGHGRPRSRRPAPRIGSTVTLSDAWVDPGQADVPQQPRRPARHAGQGARRGQQPRPAAGRGAGPGDPRRQRRGRRTALGPEAARRSTACARPAWSTSAPTRSRPPSAVVLVGGPVKGATAEDTASRLAGYVQLARALDSGGSGAVVVTATDSSDPAAAGPARHRGAQGR